MTPKGLTGLDWIIVLGYAFLTIGLGYYYSRKQRTLNEYFIGSGSMSPTLIGVSLFASLLSTISYLSIPGEAIGKGPVWMLNYLTIPIIYFVVGYGLIPVYMRSRVTSAYELLETKLGVGIRLMGAVLFILLRLVWMALLVYLSAKAMSLMLGIGANWIPVITLVTGLIAIIYTSMGGLRAVVITDLLQTLLMLGGALFVIVMISIHFKGLGWMPTVWQPHWDQQPIFSLDPAVRLTIIGSMLSSLTWTIATAGGDQTVVQRFMATIAARAARRSYLVQQLVGLSIGITLWLAGFALLSFFRSQPDLLPEGINLDSKADLVFPHYITNYLPPGVSGFVIAAMFAAAMSSLDSGVNAITAVVSSDFIKRFRTGSNIEKQLANTVKYLAFIIGAIVVGASSLMEFVPGNITAVTNKTANLLTTPIFALFFFALFVPFARPLGVIVGSICGIITASLIAFSGPVFGMNSDGNDPVSFIWISPIALAVNLSVGTVISWLLTRYSIIKKNP